MKVAVLSVALLFTILLCTPEDAQAFLEEGGNKVREVSSGVDLEVTQSGELEGNVVLPSLAGTGDIPVTSEVS
ncbi:unnamed protein product, partial [Bubo scandiacus]